MNSTSLTKTLPNTLGRYWGLIVLIIWGGLLLAIGVIRTTPYGIDEGAARGLLLIWSVADKIVNPIVTLGVPDFRALLFIPLGTYWPGSILAAKVLTMLLAFAAVTLFYRWSRQGTDTETALIASALLLITPQFINQVDAIGAGIYLLLAFGVGLWLNEAYRRAHHAFSAWFFLQLLWVAFTITLHPAGLAYPLALGWSWYKDPIDPRQKRHLLLGLLLVTAVVLAIRGGWSTVHWGVNPIMSLSVAHQAVTGLAEPNWLIGVLLAALLVAVAWADRYFLIGDFVGRMLLLAGVIGLAAADSAWVLVMMALLLYRGTALLIRLNERIKGETLLHQRGLVLAVGFLLTTTCMLADKSHAHAVGLGALDPQDQLIQFLAQDLSQAMADNKQEKFTVASQWPGRTMLAVRRDVFPLPEGAKDGPTLLNNIKGIDFLVFDHGDVRNRKLTDNISEVGGKAETLFLDSGGVVLQIH